MKNLPAGTQASQLREIFEKYGQLGRVILPPSGVTALIEFTEVTEAKAAFRNLAYTKVGLGIKYLAKTKYINHRPQNQLYCFLNF